MFNPNDYLSILSFQSGNHEKTFQERLTKLIDLLNYSEENNIDLILTPECYLTGYQSNKEEVWKNAISLTHKTFTQFLKKIKNFKSTLILGANIILENKLYNSALVIEKGKATGRYDKVYCGYEFHTSGNSFDFFTKKNIDFGIIICRDANYIEPARIQALKGAKVIFCLLNNSLPHDVAARWNNRSKNNLIARAVENACFVVSSDVAFQNETQTSFGASYILNHDGEIITKSLDFKEDYLIYRIPLSEFENRKIFFGKKSKKSTWIQLQTEMNSQKLL